MTVGKMLTPGPAAAAGDLGIKRYESQLKIQQLESDSLRMRLIDAESSSDRRRHALEQGIKLVSRISEFLPRDALQCKARSCHRMSSVRLSVGHAHRLCPHDSTYDHDFFTIWQTHDSSFLPPNFVSIL